MQSRLLACTLLGLAAPLTAQDRVTLSNGDVLTGKVQTMVEGSLTLSNPVMGELKVPMSDVENLSTEEPVRLLTNQGELLRRRVAGIEEGLLKMSGGGDGAPEAASMSLDNLAKINPQEKKPPKWTGSVKVASSYTSGNSDVRTVGMSFEAERRSEIDRITADASWDFGENKDQTTRDWELTQRRAGGGLKYDYFLDEKWYSLATTRVLGDTLARIDLRYTVGVGLGHQVIESETQSLLVEVGLSYFNESYRGRRPNIPAAPSQDYIAARVAYKVRHRFNEQTRLIHAVEAYPSLEESEDVYFQATTEVQTNLSESMIGSVSWIWDYDNTPSPGNERGDHRVVLSVGWTF